MTASNSRVFRFADVEVQARELRATRAGQPLALEPKAFRVLLYLLNNPGHLVTKEELLTAVWGDTAVTDNSLTRAVALLRRVLEDDPRTPEFIETVSTAGYRFICPVETEAEASKSFLNGDVHAARANGAVAGLASPGVSAASAPKVTAVGTSSRRWAVAGACALLAVAVAAAGWYVRRPLPMAKPIESLAVLPLENLSHDAEQDYFAEGMTDQLITDLAKISALRVVSRTSVMQYKGTKKPVSQIARELNVDAVLEGTVTRDENRVRITAQLIRAEPEKHLWADTYEAGLSGVLTVQDAVAKAVAQAIQIKVTPRERSVLSTPREVDPAAYEAYLKGRYLWGLTGEENLKKSQEYFEQSIQKDPGYALAWAGLADTYSYLAMWGVLSYQDAFPRAKAAAEKALELDNSLAGPLVTLALVKMNYEWDWAGTEQLLKQAIELSPNYGTAHHVYATYLAEVGRTQEAVAEAQRAREVEPLSVEFCANVVWKLYLARQYGEAELESSKLKAWSGHGASYALASVYLETGRRREAIAELQRDVAASHGGLLELMYLGHALGVSGDRAEAKKVLDEMQVQQRYVPPLYFAIVYEGLGDRGRALDWFEKAVAERSVNGWILPDPRLDQIRTEPRFQVLMRRMGLPK